MTSLVLLVLSNQQRVRQIIEIEDPDVVFDLRALNGKDRSQYDDVRQIIEIEDPDVVFDLRALNGKDRSQYDDFWNECQKFLQEDISVAVDERRHGQICHLSRAISIRDFVEQVKQRCPEGTLILNGLGCSFGRRLDHP